MQRSRLASPLLLSLGLAMVGALMAASLSAVEPTDTPDREAIVLRPASPPGPEAQRSLEEWHVHYAGELAPVIDTWRLLLGALGEHWSHGIEGRCRELARALRELDANLLLPAPDPVVDLHFRGLLAELGRAASTCTRERYFDIGYRLDEARRSLRQVEMVLANRYRLEP